ncbi:MAG: UDP-N-acetylglucosamine 2-epimerase (non-hydrolyzing) [Candidatus Aminicenantes bacterium]|nr:UDP-N-acetylglucosamine 2-epimerase (non-hydrolyzing) [Candidatus Aminicenantes bacterium]
MKAVKSKKIKVLVVMGTRPEVIKLAPVIHALRAYSRTGKEGKKEGKTKQKTEKRFETLVCLTGQHREMVEPFLKVFDLKPDYDLRVMEPNQHLADVAGKVLLGMKKILSAEKPDWVLVQGDTTSALAAALAAFYSRVKVGHVEAGLRTEDRFNPFPEEINRRLISPLADLNFAPTERARKNLLAEGISTERVLVTGNTVVDALKMILRKTGSKKWYSNLRLIRESMVGQGSQKFLSENQYPEGITGRDKSKQSEKEREKRSGKASGSDFSDKRGGHQELTAEKIKKLKEALFSQGSRSQRTKKLILVTAHRRESFGKGMEEICRAIRRVVEKVPEAEVVFPVHLNPEVRRVVLRELGGHERIWLVEPVDYLTFVMMMREASLIMTDSGGIQEEAPSLGVPVVVMREKTERPEAVEAGVAWIGGTKAESIEKLALRLLKEVESSEFRRGLQRRNPFGDGRASWRILRALF